MKFIFFIFPFVLGFFLNSCNVKDQNCDLQYVDLSHKTYRIKGCLNNQSLEDGNWEVYDSANSVVENGSYSNGIRVGVWNYPQENNLSLTWNKYSYEKIGLLTNILAGFAMVESDSSSVKLSNSDSSNLINIVIALHDLGSTNIDPEEYHKQGENEITQRGWQFQQNRTELILKDRKAYFNEYKVTLDASDRGKTFYLSNIYSIISDNKLVEITCRYSDKGGLEARKMFFGIMTNCYIDGQRFFNPFEKVENIIERKQ